jgi:DEAD/DEAH box helicase domain-containing protein
LNEEVGTVLADGLEEMFFNLKETLPEPLRLMLDATLWTHHAIAVLVGWLAKTTGDHGDREAIRIGRHAGATAFRMVPNPSIAALDEARAKLAQFWTNVTNLSCERSIQSVASGNLNDLCVTLRYWWAKELADPTVPLPVSPGFVIYDEGQAHDEPTRHLMWRRWLWLFNIFQTLPGVLLATQAGFQDNDHAGLRIITSARPGAGAQKAAHGAAWQEVLDQTVSALIEGLNVLIGAGLDPPDEVGYEMEQSGEVVAEAELAWIGRKLVLLMPAHMDYRAVWEAHGWKTVIAEGEWQQQLIESLANRAVEESSLQEKK